MSIKNLAAQPSAGAQAWAGYCRLCGTARKVSPCHKCSVPLSPLMADHEEPDLPDIEQIRTLAAEVGYAVGVHGSMERDLDVIATPWVETAVSAPDLAAHLAKGLNARLLNDKVQDKPCGRWSCCIQIDGWFKHIDLSVCATPAQPPAHAVDIVPSHCTGASLSFEPGVLYVSKDGSGYIAIDERHFSLEDDRCDGPDGPEGGVHWITRMDASEVVALRDFLNGSTSTPAQPDTGDVAALREAVEWYGEQARLARLIHSEGDAGRSALAADGGKRALAALSKPNAPGAA